MRQVINLICSHGLSIATGIIVGCVATLFFVDPPDANWTKVDLISATGSILAGTGTIGLLWFGWVKSDEWKHRLYEEKRIDKKIKVLDELNCAVFQLKQEIQTFSEYPQTQLTINPIKLHSSIKSKIALLDAFEWTKNQQEIEEIKKVLKALSLELGSFYFILRNREIYSKEDIRLISAHCDVIAVHSNALLSFLLATK